ncbi:hypothetical protein WJX73_000932 [Symbiochloris irregularis]|uniref:FHA domain-containing protein n=1 Tax=Symbiochloris irregularis TaxID=706552 RepID=A0AAW1NXZ9_9CHLO
MATQNPALATASPLPLPTSPRDAQLGRKRSAGNELVEGVRPKKQTRFSNGDAEMTESDSEADSLFPEDLAATEIRLEAAGAEETPGALHQRQLVQRRLDNTTRLRQLYTAEYWSLLEEFRVRHNHILRKARLHTQDAVKSELGEQGEPGVKDFVSMQALMQSTSPPRRVPCAPGPSSSTLADDSRLRSESKSAGEAPPGPAPEQQGAAAQEGRGAGAPLGAVSDEPASSAEQQARSASESLPAPSQDGAARPSPPPQNGHAQSGLGQDRGGVPGFEHVKAVVFSVDPALPVVSHQQLSSWRSKFRSHMQEVSRLEQAAAAAGAREMDREGALAVLLSHAVQYTICRSAASVGRNTGSCGPNQVDVDLTLAGCAKRVSRKQATLALGTDGQFMLRNVGRRAFFVNSRMVNQNQEAPLSHLSHLDIGGLQLLFLINHLAVRRVMITTQHHSVLGQTI